jgi:uncharacterized tellurite resistance protein B-like protein
MDAREARRQRREQRKAERQMKREDRQKLRADRKAMRKARRAANRQARQERREARNQNQNSLINRLLGKVDEFFDHEFDKIKSEYQAKEAQGAIKANPNLKLMDVVETLRPYSGSYSQQEQKVYDSLVLASEITDRFKYQLRMVYEIAIANGYSTQQLPKEAVVYIMLSGLSSRVFAQPLINAQKQIVVKPFMDDPEARKAVGRAIATVVAMKVLRSVAARFLPGIGPMILDLFIKNTTPDLYVNAKYLFSQQPQFLLSQNGTLLKAAETLISEAASTNSLDDDDDDFIRLLSLINLMKKDGKIDERERELFDTMLLNSDLDEDEKEEIEESLDDDEIDQINLNRYKNNPDESKALITDLVAIAKIDRSISQDEAEYIFKICDEIGFNRDAAKMMLV